MVTPINGTHRYGSNRPGTGLHSRGDCQERLYIVARKRVNGATSLHIIIAFVVARSQRARQGAGAAAAMARGQGHTAVVDYGAAGGSAGERVVVHNSHWLAVVPCGRSGLLKPSLCPAAVSDTCPILSSAEKGCADGALESRTLRVRRLFDKSFPYSFGWHGAPRGAMGLRVLAAARAFLSAVAALGHVKKFLAGYEMLAEPPTRYHPELAAERLASACVWPACHAVSAGNTQSVC